MQLGFFIFFVSLAFHVKGRIAEVPLAHIHTGLVS